MSVSNTDLLALKAYVTAGDSTQYSQLSETTLVLDLTHSNLKQRHAEIRFDKTQTIHDLRNKIHQKTGTPPSMQHLQFYANGYGNSSQPLVEISPESMTDGDRMLGYFHLPHGTTVHCIDLDPHSASRGGAYEDVTLVEKYRMSDEEYEKRRGTLRDWARKEKEHDPNFNLARHAVQHRQLVEARRLAKLGMDLPPGFGYDSSGNVVREEEEDDDDQVVDGAKTDNAEVENQATEEEQEHGPKSVEEIRIGSRCEVRPGGRRGVVAFVGQVPQLPSKTGSYWVGVVFDEPVGRTDGTVADGTRYFDAEPGRGGFLRGKNVAVGDFPERDILDELSDDSDDDEL